MSSQEPISEEPILSKAQHEALVHGAIVLIDQLFMDLIKVAQGMPIEDTEVLYTALPSQHRIYYNELFIKKFIVCAVRVADRLTEWDEESIPASTAECLALRAIVEEAKTWLELREHPDRDDLDFALFDDCAFPDNDIEFLFDSKFKNIENTPIAKEMGMVLKPEEWLVPFYGSVHPYTRGE